MMTPPSPTSSEKSQLQQQQPSTPSSASSQKSFTLSVEGDPRTLRQSRSAQETAKLKRLLASSRILQQYEMCFISRLLSLEEWRAAALQLGFSARQLDKIETEFKEKGVKEIIYQSLLKWLERNDKPTVGRVATALWQVDPEIVQRLLECDEKERESEQPRGFRRLLSVMGISK